MGYILDKPESLEKRRLIQSIGFLTHEIQMGFENEWSREIERESVFLYLEEVVKSQLYKHKYNSSTFDKDWINAHPGRVDEHRMLEMSNTSIKMYNETIALRDQPIFGCREAFETLKPHAAEWFPALRPSDEPGGKDRMKAKLDEILEILADKLSLVWDE